MLSLQCLYTCKNEKSYTSASHVPAGHVMGNSDIPPIHYGAAAPSEPWPPAKGTSKTVMLGMYKKTCNGNEIGLSSYYKTLNKLNVRLHGREFNSINVYTSFSALKKK